MCGIAGAMDLTGRRSFPDSPLHAMLAAIEHRGPDDEFSHSEPGLALGARRLAIIDPQRGRQPLCNERGDIWVAVNGEIYDADAWSEQLLAAGHRLRTQCDTELWVHLYEEIGERVFDRLNAQFAVSLWDRRERTLLLGRDRVGICPLFYAQADGWLLWASEIKSLLSSGMIDPRPDPRGLDYFFHFFSAPLTRTCFAGISALAPGHFLRVRSGRMDIRQYWDLEFPTSGHETCYHNTQTPRDELESRLRSATRRRLRSDAPFAAYVSGGIDSAVILKLATQESGHEIPSLTIGLDGAGVDERNDAAQTAGIIGSPLTTVTMADDAVVQRLPEVVHCAEMPVLDTSCACLSQLAAAAQQHGYKVILTGEGADEALAGYLWFKSHLLGLRLGATMPNLLHRHVLHEIGGRIPHPPPHNALGGARPVQQDLAELLSQTRATLYSPNMWSQIGDYSAFADVQTPADGLSRLHPLNRCLYVGYKVMLPGLLLAAKGDRVAMHSAIETRYPFLDDEVINFCAQLHPRYKLRGWSEKWLLRRMAERILPAAIAHRRKVMFRSGRSAMFLAANRPPWIDELLSEPSLRATGYFNPAAVAATRHALKPTRFRLPFGSEVLTPHRSFLDLALLGVISTQLWHHTYFGGRLCSLPAWSPAAASTTHRLRFKPARAG